VIIASFQEYLPVEDLLKIIAVCVAVAVIAPSAAALVITGFEAQSNSHRAGGGRGLGELRIALGVLIVAALIVVGIVAMTKK
jgi:hypothetical protein